MRTAKPVAKKFSSGIGSRLHKIIEEKTGIKPCGTCLSKINRLNSMSSEQANAEFDKIVAEILHQAQTTKAKWYLQAGAILIPGIARSVIGGWVKEAIGAPI